MIGAVDNLMLLILLNIVFIKFSFIKLIKYQFVRFLNIWGILNKSNSSSINFVESINKFSLDPVSKDKISNNLNLSLPFAKEELSSTLDLSSEDDNLRVSFNKDYSTNFLYSYLAGLWEGDTIGGRSGYRRE